MHLIKEKLLFMEVSIICSSFIYGERHEERVSGVGGGGGESTKMYIKIFFSRIRGKNGSGNNSNLKKTLLNLCFLKKGDKAVLQ